jgi:hypothetical protein
MVAKILGSRFSTHPVHKLLKLRRCSFAAIVHRESNRRIVNKHPNEHVLKSFCYIKSNETSLLPIPKSILIVSNFRVLFAVNVFLFHVCFMLRRPSHNSALFTATKKYYLSLRNLFSLLKSKKTENSMNEESEMERQTRKHVFFT